VIYINGPNLTAESADKLLEWVHDGGTLYTSGGGLRFDEANQPLKAMNSVLGLKQRSPIEIWKRVEIYKGTTVESFDEPDRQIADVPDGATVRLQATPPSELEPIIGREVLLPAENTETLGRFADGSAAVTRCKHGAGTVWVVGLFPGLEYSVPLRAAAYDMSRDLTAARRQFITLPCQGRVRPVVDCDRATVEGVLLRNTATGKLAVTLMNWAYRVAGREDGSRDTKPAVELVPCENLELRIRGTGKIASVRSASTGKSVEAMYEKDELTLTLPHLEEGDVLLLD
jgi:hypothetical protein